MSGFLQTVGESISEGTDLLKNVSETPRLDAEILLAKVLETDRFTLFTKYSETLPPEKKEKYDNFLKRRSNFEPVAYITNEKEFFEDTFFVDERVLIPRPETEFIVEKAISLLKNREKTEILDICCGSGCIGLSIKRACETALTLADLSQKALEVAEINAEKLFPSDKTIRFVQSDLFDKIDGQFDIITANPPYLSEEDMKKFVVKDLIFEPEAAFYGGKDGFEITKKIIELAGGFLKPEGFLILELGYEGADFLKETASTLELKEIIKDYAGIERTAVFRKS